MIDKALKIAFEKHQGQFDKGGQPYILHPIRVAEKCSTMQEKIVALLHDTIEDTDITPQTLQEYGFSEIIIEAVLSVTRKENESYDDFIKRCSLNEIGRKVKLHDLEDNMDITRLQEITEKDVARLQKYLKAYHYLKSI